MANELDASLKSLMKDAREAVPELIRSRFAAESFGSMKVVDRLNVELHFADKWISDWVLRLEDHSLLHLEFQAYNHPQMAQRMFIYCGHIFEAYKVVPRQLMLYVGREPMRMEDTVKGLNWTYRYEAMDMREVNGERLVESENWADKIIGLLGRLRDREQTARRVAHKIGSLTLQGAVDAFELLVRIAPLRDLEEIVKEEVRKVPELRNILENKILAPAFEQGVEEGKKQGVEEGMKRGVVHLLRCLIVERFGAIPDWVERCISSSATNPEDVAIRVLKANNLEELFHS